MKRFIFYLLLLFTPLSFAATEKYEFDPNHTYVLWQVNHFGFSHPSGKWLASGTLLGDADKPENSKLTVTIKLGDIVTGIPKFDNHLRSADFFDVAKYPIATFTSQKIEVTGKNTAKVYGTLNLHGVTKPVVLDVVLNKVDVSPINQKKTAGFSATTQLKRSDFGLAKFVPGVSDEVKINIEAEANKST